MGKKIGGFVSFWHYEKSAIFTVRSAYKLAIQKEYEDKWCTGSQIQRVAAHYTRVCGPLRYHRCPQGAHICLEIKRGGPCDTM
jgi:hypothetical protein